MDYGPKMIIFTHLDAGQNVSHDDLFTAVLWEILTEF